MNDQILEHTNAKIFMNDHSLMHTNYIVIKQQIPIKALKDAARHPNEPSAYRYPKNK